MKYSNSYILYEMGGQASTLASIIESLFISSAFPCCYTVTQSLYAKSLPSKSASLFKQLSFHFRVD